MKWGCLPAGGSSVRRGSGGESGSTFPPPLAPLFPLISSHLLLSASCPARACLWSPPLPPLANLHSSLRTCGLPKDIAALCLTRPMLSLLTANISRTSVLALGHGDDDLADLACGAILLWSVNKSHRHVECDECVSHDSFLFCFCCCCCVFNLAHD